MKSLTAIIMSLGVALALGSPMTSEQCLPFAKGPDHDKEMQLFLDGKKTRVEGKLERIDAFSPEEGSCAIVVIRLETPSEHYQVFLGPRWYLRARQFALEVGDHVSVEGSRSVLNGKLVMIASRIKKGAATLPLRESSGFPIWANPAGWPRPAGA